MPVLLRRMAAEERGATAIEYALMASLLSIAAMAAFENMATSLVGAFQMIADRLSVVAQVGS